MGAQVSDNVHGVQALRRIESGSHHSIYSECLAVILVRVYYHSNRHCLSEYLAYTHNAKISDNDQLKLKRVMIDF